jgi:hypothetical protein
MGAGKCALLALRSDMRARYEIESHLQADLNCATAKSELLTACCPSLPLMPTPTWACSSGACVHHKQASQSSVSAHTAGCNAQSIETCVCAVITPPSTAPPAVAPVLTLFTQLGTSNLNSNFNFNTVTHLLQHGHVVGPITDGQRHRCGLYVVLDHAHEDGLLLGRHAAGNDSVALARHLRVCVAAMRACVDAASTARRQERGGGGVCEIL